jgi:AcrR family transcriptional regulator
MRAADRREVVIRAGVREFGTHGYAGTTTQSIAAQVGVSQPYLFRLFGTKKSMFISVVRYGFERCRAAFGASATAAGARTPDEILEAMGRTYADLLVDGDLPRLLFQAYAACDDPDIRAVVRQESTTLREAVARWSGADDTTLRAWFAEGMLLNVDAAVGDLTPGHHRSEQVALADRRRIGHPASSRNRPSARGRAQTGHRGAFLGGGERI